VSTPSTDIAVIGWAQTPMVRHTDKSETQLLMDAITGAVTPLGLGRADIDFTCLGSCDYITGQAFSFVSNLDAIGAWPPKRDSHVEMDGAWALYEACSACRRATSRSPWSPVPGGPRRATRH